MDGSYIEPYEFMSDILACNNGNKGTTEKLRNLGLKYKSGSDNLLNDEQKSLVVRFELLK